MDSSSRWPAAGQAPGGVDFESRALRRQTMNASDLLRKLNELVLQAAPTECLARHLARNAGRGQRGCGGCAGRHRGGRGGRGGTGGTENGAAGRAQLGSV